MNQSGDLSPSGADRKNKEAYLMIYDRRLSVLGVCHGLSQPVRRDRKSAANQMGAQFRLKHVLASVGLYQCAFATQIMFLIF